MHVPPDFARTLVQVLQPGDEAGAARILKAATRLDDDRLRVFLELFAARVRDSREPVRQEELQEFLRTSMKRGRPASP